MPDGGWHVDAMSAFAAWEARHRPTATEKGDMSRWLERCEREGPPSAHDIDDAGNLIAEGANNTQIRFRRWDFPNRDPRGYMFVLLIE